MHGRKNIKKTSNGAGLLYVTIQIWKHCNGSTNAILSFRVSISVVVLHRQILYGLKTGFLLMKLFTAWRCSRASWWEQKIHLGGGEVIISGHKRVTDRRIQKLHGDNYCNTYWFCSPSTLVNKSRKKRLEGTWYAQRNEKLTHFALNPWGKIPYGKSKCREKHSSNTSMPVSVHCKER